MKEEHELKPIFEYKKSLVSFKKAICFNINSNFSVEAKLRLKNYGISIKAKELIAARKMYSKFKHYRSSILLLGLVTLETKNDVVRIRLYLNYFKKKKPQKINKLAHYNKKFYNSFINNLTEFKEIQDFYDNLQKS